MNLSFRGGKTPQALKANILIKLPPWYSWIENVRFLIWLRLVPNSFFIVSIIGLVRLFFLEKLWIWVLTELIFRLMLTELIKRTESLSSIVLFIILEVSLSVSLLAAFFLERRLLLSLFCIGKLGLIPLWFWVLRLFNGLDSRSLFRIMTVYKIIPLRILLIFVRRSFVLSLVCLNRIVVFNLLGRRFSLNTLLGLLVIFSTGWLLAASTRRRFSVVLFFILYLFMLRILLFSEKVDISLVSVLFYSGLPPLGSFFGKLFVLSRRGRAWGILFIPLFIGLMVVTVFLFLTTPSKKRRMVFFLFFLRAGLFLYWRSFAEASAF